MTSNRVKIEKNRLSGKTCDYVALCFAFHISKKRQLSFSAIKYFWMAKFEIS